MSTAKLRKYLFVALICLGTLFAYLAVLAFFGFLPHGARQLLPRKWLGGPYEAYAGGGRYKGGDPAISRVGSLIVYSTPRTGRGDLYLVDPTGTSERRLTSDPNYEGYASFSPDGTKIVFIREKNLVSHVWVMNADGTGERQLTSGHDDHFDPVFTPDSRRVVFGRVTRNVWSGDSVALYSVNINGRQTKPFSIKGAFSITFSHRSGKVFYFSTQPKPGSWVSNEDGSGKRRVKVPAKPGLSPDGNRLVYPYEPDWESLWIVNVDGTNRKKIYQSRGYKARPRFTPDGKRILFLNEPEGRGVGDIFLINLDGSNPQIVTSTR